MKVISVLRSALVMAVVLGLCATDAKKVKQCEVDHPAPTPAKTGAPPAKPVTPVVVPTSTTSAPVPAQPAATPAPQVQPAPVPAKPSAPETAAPDAGAATVGPVQPAATPAPAPAPAPTPAPAPAPAPAPGGSATKSGTIKASFVYKGKDAGGPGSYDMVTDINTCGKTPHSMYSPVSPLDDDLTIVFRGPMTIFNIAVFDGSSGAWNKVSSYEKGGATNNMVFMNNRNIDYGGKSAPQGFATADGRGKASGPTAFAGQLGAATSPNGFSIYADEKTGAEVNILQDKKCGQGVDCKGYYDKDGTAHIGWGGGKKIFITKVQMPHGGAPNLPAIWALNGQIVRSNQYQCNCRGMGGKGGCGELDIAEVIEKDANVVATHYYHYGDGTGHDSWGKRPTDAPTTYITVIDESFGVKVLEIGGDDFDFGAGSISSDVVSKWLSS